METCCEAWRPLVFKISTTAATSQSQGEPVDVKVQTNLGAHDDDEETAVHDARAQVEAGHSPPKISHKISRSFLASKEKAKDGPCKIPWQMDSQKENKNEKTASNV